MFALIGAVLLNAAVASVSSAQAPDIVPPVVDRRDEVQLTPEQQEEIEDLEERQHAAEGRSAAFGALTIGGTVLLVGGVVAMIVPGVIDLEGCTMDCVKPFEDFAPGMGITITGIIAILVGGILWGDADRSADELGRQIEELRHPVPTFTFGPNGARVGLRGSF